ncbi:curli assembly protein CsgF [Shewanella corallii]|uniref:Curli production assembly/transport component CsgF n=1 Tax=Shewanella corallii TaxID=560080 RepID=A0ABT0N2M2_9GAMM|nr:curli assembly protein CsgF [Shewanella corallii]MCL2912679.1 curli assembly protein CsgF [Shewanella corallii]
MINKAKLTGWRPVLVGLSLAFCASSGATELVYTPINPTFGGNPLNGTFLLNKANAQNKHTEAADDKDFETRFRESLERNIINTITRNVADGELTEGYYNTGQHEIQITPTASGVTITITNIETGEVTVIEVDTPGGG